MKLSSLGLTLTSRKKCKVRHKMNRTTQETLADFLQVQTVSNIYT